MVSSILLSSPQMLEILSQGNGETEVTNEAIHMTVFNTVCARYRVNSLIYVISFNRHKSPENVTYHRFANEETEI